MTQQEAGNGPQRPDPEELHSSSKAWFIVALAVVAVLLVGLVVWLLATANSRALDIGPADLPTPGSVVTTTAAPPTPLPLPREAAPVDFRLGDCFSDFRPEAQQSTLVACDSPHSAQFVASYTYEDDETYPGAEVLKAKALEACRAAALSPAAGQYMLNYERVYPSSTSWEVGDRRVDCFVAAPEGNVITTSVLP